MSDRNNLERLGVEEEELEEVTPESTSSSFSFEDFINPTEIVDLPSGGKYYPKDSYLAGLKNVEIKMMTAYHEGILANKTFHNNGQMIHKMIGALLVDAQINPLELLSADRTAIMVAARKTAYGDEFEASTICPVCTHPNKIKINLDEDCVVSEGGDIEDYGVKLKGGKFHMTLPASGAPIIVKPMTGKVEDVMFKQSQFMKKKKQGEAGIVQQMQNVIESVAGERDTNKLHKFIQNMPAKDSLYFRKAYRECSPICGVRKSIECTECDYIWEQEVGLTTDFFWPQS